MKIFNLLFKSLFLITLIISISSCKKKTDKKNIDAFCTTYNGRPEQSISYKEMATMITQYKATRANVLKNALGFEDTHKLGTNRLFEKVSSLCRETFKR